MPSPIIRPTSADLKNAWPQFRTPSPTATTEEQFANAVRLVDNVDATACDMSQTLEYKMNHDSADPKQNRERFQQLTQNPKVKIGKVFAADVRKGRIHPTVKKITAWRKANRLSQPKAVAVLGQHCFHITFASLRSWEEGRSGYACEIRRVSCTRPGSPFSVQPFHGVDSYREDHEIVAVLTQGLGLFLHSSIRQSGFTETRYDQHRILDGNNWSVFPV